MTFDLAEQQPAALTNISYSLQSFQGTDRIRRRRLDTVVRKSIEWRRTLFGIVNDSLGQIEPERQTEYDALWRHEAQQRALNLTCLSLSECVSRADTGTRSNLPIWDITAVETLGGAYRLLAKCDGEKLVQCDPLLRGIVVNLLSAYAPVHGRLELELTLHSLALMPVKCRALVLCVGMLLQGIMRQSRHRTPHGLKIELTSKDEDAFILSLTIPGDRTALLDTPEFELAMRLSGLLQAELLCACPQNKSFQIALTFPVPIFNSADATL